MSQSVSSLDPHSQARARAVTLQLRQSDQLFSVVQDGVMLLDTDAVIVDVNPAATRMFGYSCEEVVGRRPVFLEDSPTQSLLAVIRTALGERGQWSGDFPFRRKDGTTGFSETVVVAQKDADGELIGYLSVFRDVSERHLIEYAVQESESSYRMLFDAHPLPMWVFDVETLHFLDVNEAAIQRYGYSRQEFLTLTIADIRPDSELQKLRALITVDGHSGESRFRDVVHRQKDGTVFEVTVVACNVSFLGRAARLVTACDNGTHGHVHDVHDMIAEQQRRIAELEAQLKITRSGNSSEETPHLSPPASTHVLLVEDDDGVRESLTRMLQKAGLTVASASNGPEALQIWAQSSERFDLLISDGVMPGMRGVELIRRIRQQSPHIPVILISGYMGERLGPDFLGGSISMLEKPFTASVLIQRIRELLPAASTLTR